MLLLIHALEYALVWLIVALEKEEQTIRWFTECPCNLFILKPLFMQISYVLSSPETNHYFKLTSSNGNISRVTGPLCGEFTGPGEFPAQRPVTRSLMFSLICARINGWVNNRYAGDLRRNQVHYDVIVMLLEADTRMQSLLFYKT